MADIDSMIKKSEKLKSKLEKAEEKFSRAETRIEVLKNREMALLNRIQSRENRQDRKIRFRRMCILAGGIEKIYREKYGEKIFDSEDAEEKTEIILKIFSEALNDELLLLDTDF